MDSAEQDQWKEICATVRQQLARQVQLMPAMKPEEVVGLINAIDTAMWNEVKAESFDEAVAEHKATLTRAAAFGG